MRFLEPATAADPAGRLLDRLGVTRLLEVAW
jgi:hypothetical protein